MAKRRKQPPLSDQALEIVAARFKALADPTRLRLLRALENGEKNVSQLVAATGGLQANVSKQLAALANAGMVGRRKAGLKVFYFIADETIFKLCALMCSRLQKEFDLKSSHFSG
ncbi:MAG TPA: metalloregulator ArsR/SmtB family transcription factor [Verrucomicrobiae bacterium]|nr:metalloregulator ArsR/SmtB family transcription factor [Verrucomicrobiae bacterium]